jgi:transcriptional regulator with XRE-family HTH domain
LTTFGRRLSVLRKENKLTQEELARRAGLTQSIVSRLERSGQVQRVPVGVLALVAGGLGIDQQKLVAGTALEKLLVEATLDEDAGRHLAYCPNPNCGRNRIEKDGYGFHLRWDSAEALDAREYDALRYCGSCHTELIRLCPACGKRVRHAPEHYCSRCGQQIHDRPTLQELEVLQEEFGRPLDSFPHLGGRLKWKPSGPESWPGDDTGPEDDGPQD